MGSISAAVIAKKLMKLQDTLKKGAVLIEEHIKMADRSEFGWGMVCQSISDELAKDEKHMKKAKKAERRKTDQLAKKAPAAGKAHYFQQPTYVHPQAHTRFIPCRWACRIKCLAIGHYGE